MTDALDKSVWDRLGIAALFGLAYFVVWPLWSGYVELSAKGDGVDSSGLLAIAVIAALFSIYIIRGRSKKRLSRVLLLLLVFSWLGLRFWAYQVHHLMSLALGYFDGAPLVSTAKPGRTPYRFNDMRFTIDLLPTWQARKLMPFGVDYFDRQEAGKLLAQLRPKCFHNEEASLAQTVQRYLRQQQSEGRQVGKQCYRDDVTVSCILSHQSHKDVKVVWRTRWFTVNPKTRQGVELDFLLYDHSPVLHQEIVDIIVSTRLDKLNESPACVRIMDWQ